MSVYKWGKSEWIWEIKIGKKLWEETKRCWGRFRGNQTQVTWNLIGCYRLEYKDIEGSGVPGRRGQRRTNKKLFRNATWNLMLFMLSKILFKNTLRGSYTTNQFSFILGIQVWFNLCEWTNAMHRIKL